MFHQSALSERLSGLRASGIELGLRLGDIEAGCDAGIVTLLGEAERARVGCYRLIEDRAVAVEAAQLNVIVDQLRDQRKASILEVSGGRSGAGLAGGDLVANLAPQVELVTNAATHRVGIVGGRRGGSSERRIERF